MKSKGLEPLKVSLHGMDVRMRKKMEYYLKLPCKGAAIVVDEDEAQVEIVDVDLSLSKSLLDERLAQQPSKPIIALSLNEISTSGVIYVKKPIVVTDVLVAFSVAKDVIFGKISLKRTDKTVDTSSKISNLHAFNETKTPRKTRLEVVSDFITEAIQKSEATRKFAGLQDYLQDVLHKKITFYNTKRKVVKVLRFKKSESLEQQKPANDELARREKPLEKSQAFPETDKNSATQDDIITRYTAFLGALWRRKSLITVLTCLLMIIAGIYIFQLMPIYEGRDRIYEARARIFISNNPPKLIDVNSSFPEDTLDLDKELAQKKINEITSRQLAERVINTLQLNTIPEFIAASININHQEQAPTSKFGQERLATEQLTNMTDYFLQNLKVSQFKNTPIIDVYYKAKDPELAARIVNQLAREYRAMQRYQKIEIENKLAEQEAKELANQDTEKIANQAQSPKLLSAPINFGNVNANNGENVNSNVGTKGPTSDRTVVNADANATGRTVTSSVGSGTGGDPFANEKVVTSTVGNGINANVGTTTATVNTLSTSNNILNIAYASDFGTVISKATAHTLTTGNFTQNVAIGDNLGEIVSNQLTNVGTNNAKLSGVNIITHVGSVSVRH